MMVTPSQWGLFSVSFLQEIQKEPDTFIQVTDLKQASFLIESESYTVVCPWRSKAAYDSRVLTFFLDAGKPNTSAQIVKEQ